MSEQIIGTVAAPPVAESVVADTTAYGHRLENVEYRTRMSFGRWFRELGWRHLVGVLAVIYALFPIVFIISASLGQGSLTASNQLFQTISFDNYRELATTPFWTWFLNTMIVAVVTAVGTVLMGAAAA